ncbi:MAG: hypothetical protein CMJ18_27535 [Phycisphaeraceae bacterium]|nr:hypothetical protein [Phycisphaeraceae bacterium]
MPARADRFPLRQVRWLALGVAILGTNIAWAETRPTAPPGFQKLLRERNELHRRLQQADRRAARQLRRGDNADVAHAEQIALQDRLDTTNTRLESLAVRHGLTIPLLETARAGDGAATDSILRKRTSASLERGRRRALHLLRADTLELLASLDLWRYTGTESGDDAR